MLNMNTETFLCCDTPLSEAQTILFGAPFDSTTSYRPGTRFGSGAIRRESFGIESYSPYQDRDLEDAFVLDCGDLELCLGDTPFALKQIELRTAEVMDAEKRPFMLGGDPPGDGPGPAHRRGGRPAGGVHPAGGPPHRGCGRRFPHLCPAGRPAL